MRKWLVVGAVVVLGAVLFLSDWPGESSRLTVAYQRQYWTKQISKTMGPAWRVTSVKQVPEPYGWDRTHGEAGIEVSFGAPGITLHHEIVGAYHPQADLYLMPANWEGTCHINGQELIVSGRGYREEGRAMMAQQYYPAVYDGRTWRYHLFRSSVAAGGLVDWERLEGTLGPRLRPPGNRLPAPRTRRP